MFYQIKQPRDLWYTKRMCLNDTYDIVTYNRRDLSVDGPSKSQTILKVTYVNSIRKQ